ncbi:MAG: hypothetical protein ACOZAO_00070 [Patescibacteria group bacterium]
MKTPTGVTRKRPRMVVGTTQVQVVEPKEAQISCKGCGETYKTKERIEQIFCKHCATRLSTRWITYL